MSYTSLNDKQEGYKLPKDCIRYDLAAKDRLNLSEMTCTVIYEGAHEQRHQLKVVGAFERRFDRGRVDLRDGV